MRRRDRTARPPRVGHLCSAVNTVRSDETGRHLSMLRWGLIPGWAKEPNIGYKLINARAETASIKPAFRAAYRDRRCLIPADGFYEWTRRGAAKHPYLIVSCPNRPRR